MKPVHKTPARKITKPVKALISAGLSTNGVPFKRLRELCYHHPFFPPMNSASIIQISKNNASTYLLIIQKTVGRQCNGGDLGIKTV